MRLPTTNLLIHGDNREVLEALQSTHRGTVQLVYIDPPYNTGLSIRGDQQTQGYRDRQNSEEWLQEMSLRFERLRDLLTDSGSLMVQLDENEVDAAKLALDTLFGRANFINRIIVEARSPSSFSTVNTGLFKATEYILWYARDRKSLKTHPVRTARAPDPAYRLWLENPQAPPADWRIVPLSQAHPKANLDTIRVKHADRVCRLAPISDTKAGKRTVEAKKRSLACPDRVLVVERERYSRQYLLRGSQLVFYDKQVQEIDGRLQASRPLTNLWTDISWEGIAKEGGVVYKTGKKPEQLPAPLSPALYGSWRLGLGLLLGLRHDCRDRAQDAAALDWNRGGRGDSALARPTQPGLQRRRPTRNLTNQPVGGRWRFCLSEVG